MFNLDQPLADLPKPEAYARLAEQAAGLLRGEPDLIACAANFCALVYHQLPGLNWCGFYFFDGRELVVGPFQGRPACVRPARSCRSARRPRCRPASTSW